MNNREFLKEKVAYYKFWLAILITIDSGLITWTYNNYYKTDIADLRVLQIIIFAITLVILSMNQKARNFLNKMEE